MTLPVPTAAPAAPYAAAPAPAGFPFSPQVFAAAAQPPAAPAPAPAAPMLAPAPPAFPGYPAAPAAYPVGGVQSPTDHLTASIREGFGQLLDELRRGVTPTAAVPTPAAQIPPAGGAPLPAGAEQPAMGLQAFASLVSQVATGNGSPFELQAALSDIIPADSPSAFRPQYLTELWDATSTTRKFIDNATVTRPLTSMKIVGQRWVTKPEVGDYAGDKAPVPTNEPTLEDIPVTAKRLAGAHDVDRAYVDLGDPAWFAAYFEAQTESYRAKSDRAAALAAYTDGTLLDAAVADLLAGVIAAVVDLAGLGKDVEYVAMAPGLIAPLFGISNQDAPAFFSGAFSLAGGGDGALGNLKWFTTAGLAGAQVIVGAKEATRYHEVAPPIRIQAQNVANGGIDLGVFGYYATYNRDGNGTRKFAVGQADPTP